MRGANKLIQNKCFLIGEIMPIPEVEAILSKYKAEEDTIEDLLSQKKSVKNDHSQFHSLDSQQSYQKSAEEAKTRNQTIIKELETVKATLRSRATFCPTELQWDLICNNYLQDPSLPITKRRCRVPVYV